MQFDKLEERYAIKWVPRQFLTLPIVLACSLWLLVIPEAQRLSLWDNWTEERGCDEGHWHGHTIGLPWDLPEVFGTVQQVNCSRRSLLWRGLEFHVCSINKSAHTKKVWKLILCPTYIYHIYIYIYIYIYAIVIILIFSWHHSTCENISPQCTWQQFFFHFLQSVCKILSVSYNNYYWYCPYRKRIDTYGCMIGHRPEGKKQT